MGKLAASRRRTSVRASREKGTAHSSGPSAADAHLSLLELELQELLSTVRCPCPRAESAEGSSSAAVLSEFIAFLKHFLLQSFRPVRVSLVEGSATAEALAGKLRSQRATSLFGRLPGNANATATVWEATRPSKVELIGSCGAGLGPPGFSRNVDLAFELPEAALDRRDYLNYRYLAKRAAYVDAVHAQLVAELASSSTDLSERWCWAKACRNALRVEAAVLPWRFDATKSFISLRFVPYDAGSNNSPEAGAAEDACERVSKRLLRQLQTWEIRMFPCCPGGLFKEKFLRPGANAVRHRTIATRSLKGPSAGAEETLTEAQVKALPPTPYYNALVLEDTRLLCHAKMLRDCTAEFTAFADAVLLLKAWAKRRALLASGAPPFNPASGVCGFTLSLVLGHICRASGGAARVASPVQLLRMALSFLASADFREHYYCFGEEAATPKAELSEAARAQLEAAVQARNDAADATAGLANAEDAPVATQQSARLELCVGFVEDAILFDSQDKAFNILWRAQLHIQELQQEARSSLAALQSLEDPFMALFGDQQEELLLKSDMWVRLPSLPPRGEAYHLETSFPVANYEPAVPNQRYHGQGGSVEDEGMPTEKAAHIDPPKWETGVAFLGAATIGRLLLRGLSDRLQTVRVRFPPASSTKESLQTGDSADTCPVGLLVSVTLNGKASARLLDRGPQVVDTSEVVSRTPRAVSTESFKQFWGSRCDVRRFQDGRMLHCVLWEAFKASEGRVALELASAKTAWSQSPCAQIARTVLQHHAEALCSYSASWPKAETKTKTTRQAVPYPNLEIDCSPLGAVGPLSERQKALIRAFAELKNVLCALSSVPLTIKQVWHSDAALRHTEVVATNIWEPEQAQGATPTVHSVVVQFEDSGKWPVERLAVCRLKTAFLVAMHEELLRDYSVSSDVMDSHLDVHFQGFIFRIRIFHPNEVMEEANIFTDFSLKPITSQLAKSLGATGGSGRMSTTGGSGTIREERGDAKMACELLLQEDVALLYAASPPMHQDSLMQLRTLWWGPQVSALLHSVTLKHTAFAGAVRLAVSWLSSQLVVGAVHFAEHVMVFLFVDFLSAGYGDAPQSPHVAFLRFLHFVSTFDWDRNALVVTFDATAPLAEEQRQKMQVSFEHFHQFPAVQSLLDPHGFIIPRPEPPCFRRLLGCARDGYQRILALSLVSGRRLQDPTWNGLFAADLSQFDLILRFRDPLALAPAGRETAPAPQKKRRFANLQFNGESPSSPKNPLLASLLQQEADADIAMYLEAGGLSLSATSPETCAVLDDLFRRAVGTKACARRYLMLRFLRKLFQAFPNTFILGLDFVQAQQLGGGLPAIAALKIPPGTLLCRALQPTASSPSLLVSPSWDSQGACVEAAAEKGKPSEAGSSPVVGERSFMAIVSPVMLMGGIRALGRGLVDAVQRT
ncbi:nucleolar protein 6 [Cyclospora cayetanensis]|uniref:Nucleolar protein 6 n=1 Tax=Cyclospora cayetanensis TaxID=88456 RepID=A0A6P6S2X4_9EIME|nr:nucleolar protein 6 [Cyclospora cayetanensis]